MSSTSFVGNFYVESEAESSIYPIGSGIKVKISEAQGVYTVQAMHPETAIWDQITGLLVQDTIQGMIPVTKPEPHDLRFTISRIPGHLNKIKCSYSPDKTETGSWTADDEGGFPD